MGNMSYCRFENTFSALQDCHGDMEEREENGGKDEHGEELSRTEENAKLGLIELCCEIAVDYSSEVGINIEKVHG